MKTELHEADSLSLRFESQNNALNFAKKVNEDTISRSDVYGLNIAEGYINGDFALCLNVGFGSMAQKFHFVFLAIPDGDGDSERGVADNGIFVKDTAGVHGGRGNDSMFVGVSNLVESPNKIIPSFVWLKLATKEVADFRRQFFANALHSEFEFSFTVADGKVLESPRESVHGLVESGAQIVDSVHGDPLQIDWHAFDELGLMDFLASARISLNHFGAWATLVKLRQLPFELLDVTVCPSEAVL